MKGFFLLNSRISLLNSRFLKFCCSWSRKIGEKKPALLSLWFSLRLNQRATKKALLVRHASIGRMNFWHSCSRCDFSRKRRSWHAHTADQWVAAWWLLVGQTVCKCCQFGTTDVGFILLFKVTSSLIRYFYMALKNYPFHLNDFQFSARLPKSIHFMYH